MSYKPSLYVPLELFLEIEILPKTAPAYFQPIYTEETPSKKTVAKVKEAENIAELEGEVAKCCYICHPDHSPNSWPQDAQVSKIVKGFE